MSNDVERRLRGAFTALADSVDVDATPAVRPQRRPLPVLLAAAAVLVVAMGVVFALHREVAPPPAPVEPAITATSITPYAPPVAYELYTHCGIDDARIGDVFFEAVPPIPESLMSGWGNPSQLGTMQLLSPSEAIFRDDAGHTVRFRARPGATAFKRICQ